LDPTSAGAFFCSLQATTDFANTEPFLPNPAKHLPDHAGFFL
jgi:hypothetical protein